MNALRTTLARQRPRIRREGGFTLIELLVVMVMIGFTMAAFEAVYGTVVNRSSQVESQNILLTEVRPSLNQLVSDLRDATYGDNTVPIVAYSANSITFYSPDRQSPPHMRRIRYFVNGLVLQRQVTISTNTNGPPWTGIGSDTGPIETLFGTIRNPTSIFKYCVQSPPDMTIDPNNATSPDLITWSCQTPTGADQIKTVVIRTVVSTLSSSQQYNYGAVATLRWSSS